MGRADADDAGVGAFLALWLLAAVFPFAWTVWGSFKVEADFFSRQSWWFAIEGVRTQMQTGGTFTDQDGTAFRLASSQGKAQIVAMFYTSCQYICPLIIEMGNSWQQGALRPSHEHIATAIIRELLLTPVPGSQTPLNAPELVVATPAGELHELGALIVAASARDLGWYVTYLGPNLPVEEIAACAIARHATAVALSVVYPEGCSIIVEKLRRMRELLPPAMRLIVGGRAAESYRAVLPDITVQWVSCLHGLDEALCKNQA